MDPLIERLSNDPDAVSEFTRDELTEVRGLLAETGRELVAVAKNPEATTEERKEALEAAAEAKQRLAAVDEALAKFAEADADIEADADSLAEAFGEAETEDEPEDEPEAETEDTPEAETDSVEVDFEPELVPVAAAAPSIGKLAARTPRPEPKPTLTASAGPLMKAKFQSDGYRSADEVSTAMIDAWKSFGSQQVDAKALVASFDRPHDFEVHGELEHDGNVIDQVVKQYRKDLQSRYESGTLVASGGIIAPAPPVYDFYSISETAGLVQVPTVSAPRGRITFPTSPSYATIRANGAWEDAVAQEHTNANDAAGASKSSFQVTDPGSSTCTISAWPVILQYGNFQQRFYPEFVSHTTQESLNFHDHFVNGAHIADMVAASTAQVAGDPGGGTLTNVAHLLSFYAARYRDNFRMSPTAVLELVSPAWVVDALAADLVARDSTQEFGNARSRVLAVFSSLGLSVQLVQDWQSIGDNADAGYPDAADFLLYAPGTFVKLDGGSLDLGIVRDSTLNSTNDFQIFLESFEIVCEVGHDSWAINDIAICPTGATGARVSLVCPGFAS